MVSRVSYNFWRHWRILDKEDFYAKRARRARGTAKNSLPLWRKKRMSTKRLALARAEREDGRLYARSPHEE
jgi:hypothetical protein